VQFTSNAKSAENIFFKLQQINNLIYYQLSYKSIKSFIVVNIILIKITLINIFYI